MHRYVEPAATPAGTAAAVNDAGADAASNDPASSRQRSSSPWQFKVSSQAANRVRSGGEGSGSGLSTPARGVGYPRAFSGTRSYQPQVQQVQAKAAYESTLLSLVKRQMEALEEKLGSQINRIQSNDSASITLLEEKVSQTESLQPKLDKLLGLRGKYECLSDEMHRQIQRVESMDEMVRKWRQELEKDFRQATMELDGKMQKISSELRVSKAVSDEERKRLAAKLQRLETEHVERHSALEETREGLMSLHGRLQVVEQHPHLTQDTSIPTAPQPSIHAAPEMNGAYPEILAHIERRVKETADGVECMRQDIHDIAMRLGAQEEGLRGVRTLFDAREEDWRRLGERFESSGLESRLESLRHAHMEESKHRMDHHERLEIMARRLEEQERAHDEFRSAHHQFGQGPSYMLGGPHGAESAGFEGELGTDPMQELTTRIQEAEARIEALQIHEAMAPRMTQLVTQLQEYVPRVVELEKSITDLSAERLDSQKIQSALGEMSLVAPRITKVEEAVSVLNREYCELNSRLPNVIETLQQLKTAATDDVHARHVALEERCDALQKQHASFEERCNAMQKAAFGEDQLTTRCEAMREELHRTFAEELGTHRSTFDERHQNLERLYHQLQGSHEEHLERRLAAHGETFSKTLRGFEEVPRVSSEELDRRIQAHAEGIDAKHRLLQQSIEALRGSGERPHVSPDDLDRRIGAHSESIEAKHRLLEESLEELRRGHAKTERELANRDGTDRLQQLKGTDHEAHGDAINVLRQDFSVLQERVAKSEEVAATVETLRAQLDPPSTNGVGNSDQLAELIKVVRKDEEEESAVYQKLVARVDELCDRLADVAAAVVPAAIGTTGGTGAGEGAAPLSAELAEQLGSIASRVMDSEKRSSELHTQIQHKFSEMTTVMHRVAQAGDAPTGSHAG
mmetsp:Transcript_39246/g.108103  ORF Transcript_39246/g.108103 Transcript_39246/m.108103 type:complete len:917 (+) Transcript_39246:137-2887(+)